MLETREHMRVPLCAKGWATECVCVCVGVCVCAMLIHVAISHLVLSRQISMLDALPILSSY